MTLLDPYPPIREQYSWYALCVRSRHEKRVVDCLAQRAVEHFLPTYKTVHRWRNGCRKELDLPLFPGYVFTKIFLSRRVEVLKLPGAICFVSCGTKPVALEDGEFEMMKAGLQLCCAEPHPYLNSGDRVLIRRGPFAGMIGILVRKKSDFRVVLSISQIARSVIVELELTDLESMPLRPGTVGVGGETAGFRRA
jgi:transcription antitermination factor NusG